MERDEIIGLISEVKRQLGVDRLTFRAFCEASGRRGDTVFQHFDSWAAACEAAGVDCGKMGAANLVPNQPVTADECVAELKRVASQLGRDYISREEFKENSRLNPVTPCRKFGSWPAALAAADLRLSPNVRSEVPFELLANDFLKTSLEVGRVPSLVQVVRRSEHGRYLFSEKQGGYPAFKAKAVSYLLASGTELPDFLRAIPKAEACLPASPIRAHEKGRTLGFRAFAHEPTYEQEVVGLFASVAEELGFDITCMREEFPDCETLRRVPGPRKRYRKCLIEFELRSSDFLRHAHPVAGCDLVVCWLHDWNECPIEVLELRSALRGLSGWR